MKTIFTAGLCFLRSNRRFYRRVDVMLLRLIRFSKHLSSVSITTSNSIRLYRSYNNSTFRIINSQRNRITTIYEILLLTQIFASGTRVVIGRTVQLLVFRRCPLICHGRRRINYPLLLLPTKSIRIAGQTETYPKHLRK